MDAVDLEITQWMAAHRVDAVTEACRFLERLGTDPGVFTLVALAVLLVTLALRLWWGLLSVAVAWFASVVVMTPLKDVFDRPRPPADLAITTLGGTSFPSTHAIITSAAVVAVLMARWWTSPRLHRVATWLGVVLVVGSGAAMVYLGGHWASDVVAGWVIGTVVTGGVMLLWRRLPVPGGNRPVRPRPLWRRGAGRLSAGRRSARRRSASRSG